MSKSQKGSIKMNAYGKLGHHLRERMEDKGLNAAGVAAKIGCSAEHIRRAINGEFVPAPLMLKEICRVLQLDSDEMAEIANEDRMLKKFGAKAVSKLTGKDPRMSVLEAAGLATLNKDELSMVADVISGLTNKQRKTK